MSVLFFKEWTTRALIALFNFAQESLAHYVGGTFFYFDRVLPYPRDNLRGILSRFYQRFIPLTNNVTNSGIRNQNSKYLHETCFRMKVEIRLVVFFPIARKISVANSNTYLELLIQWVSVERSLRCVNTIDFQPPSKRAKEMKTNHVSFFSATFVDNSWHFYSTKIRLRVVSQCWVRGTWRAYVVVCGFAQLVATRHPNLILNTTIALSQIYTFKDHKQRE